MAGPWIAWLFLLAPTPASAVPITWAFAGAVQFSSGLQASFLDPFSGRITFESSVPDSRPADPSEGLYNNSILSVELQFGLSYLVVTTITGGGIQVNDSTTGNDVYTLEPLVSSPGMQIGTLDGSPIETIGFTITLSDYTRTMLSSDALLVVPPALPSLSKLSFNGSGFQGTGNVTSLTLPEPAPSLLVAAGIAEMAFAERARRRSATHAS